MTLKDSAILMVACIVVLVGTCAALMTLVEWVL